MSSEKFDIQNYQYNFPYHYLVNINDIPSISKNLNWGFEYISYMSVILQELEKLEYNNILDIGCGDGFLLNSIENDSKKYGIDLSKEAIAFANAFAKDSKFEIKDLFELETKYDVVSLIEVIEHIPNELLNDFIQKSIELVNIGGYLIISVPSTVEKVHKKHYRHYDEELLSKHIKCSDKLVLISDKRIYKQSLFLKFIIKLMNNNIYTINSKLLLSFFWKWHLNNNIIASKNNGKHIIRIYQKVK